MGTLQTFRSNQGGLNQMESSALRAQAFNRIVRQVLEQRYGRPQPPREIGTAERVVAEGAFADELLTLFRRAESMGLDLGRALEERLRRPTPRVM